MSSEMGFRNIVLVISYLLTIVSATSNHEPKVYEELDESSTEHVRTARHLDGPQDYYQPPVFNFRDMKQQDLLKSRYHQQQQADFRNLKISPSIHDPIHETHQPRGQNRGSRMKMPVQENDSGWKPFQPKFLHPARPIKPVRLNGRKKLTLSPKPKNIVNTNSLGNDLDASGSEKKEDVEDSDRQNDNRKYIYVTPSVLQNNFGLDATTAEHILQHSSPGSDQISELEQLIGQNPEFQLQGLQKLLRDVQPVAQKGHPTPDDKSIPSLQIQHNGSPPLPTDPEFESLKKQIDAVNKEREQKLLEAAQREAEAHVKAQHQAIALAQKQAAEEAFAKIAAHNQGLSSISASEHSSSAVTKPVHEESLDSTPESQPQENIREVDQNSLELQYQTNKVEPHEARPLEERLEHQEIQYSGSYAPSAQPLHGDHSRARGLFYQPIEISGIQHPSTVRPVHTVKEEVQNYSPVSPYAPPLVVYDTASAPQGQQTHHQIHLDSNHGGKIPHIEYDDHHHQYAAKYAFGYRIVDEKHGNDFGHEEKRDGKLTKGRYYVMLPDGRKQNVEYYVDNSGYHARVKYEQVARHPYVPHQNTDHHYNQLEPGHK